MTSMKFRFFYPPILGVVQTIEFHHASVMLWTAVVHNL